MKYKPGDKFPLIELKTIHDQPVRVPTWEYDWIHLQFRRYAGCPMCNIHLRVMMERAADLNAKKIQTVAVFHSPKEELAEMLDKIPFAIIADPERELYDSFGIEQSAKGLFHPKVAASIARSLAGGHPLRKVRPHYGIPADFLISKQGVIVDCMYGRHAADSWSVDELLKRIGAAQPA